MAGVWDPRVSVILEAPKENQERLLNPQSEKTIWHTAETIRPQLPEVILPKSSSDSSLFFNFWIYLQLCVTGRWASLRKLNTFSLGLASRKIISEKELSFSYINSLKLCFCCYLETHHFWAILQHEWITETMGFTSQFHRSFFFKFLFPQMRGKVIAITTFSGGLSFPTEMCLLE